MCLKQDPPFFRSRVLKEERRSEAISNRLGEEEREGGEGLSFFPFALFTLKAPFFFLFSLCLLLFGNFCYSLFFISRKSRMRKEKRKKKLGGSSVGEENVELSFCTTSTRREKQGNVWLLFFFSGKIAKKKLLPFFSLLLLRSPFRSFYLIFAFSAFHWGTCQNRKGRGAEQKGLANPYTTLRE